METKLKQTIPYIIIIILGSLLISKCNPVVDPKPDNKPIIETVIDHTRDTIYVPKVVYIKSDSSIVKRDENNVYDSSKHSTTYYNQTFTDSNYLLNTFGGYVDSIDLTIKTRDMIIYDSIIKTTTITNIHFKPYKHSIGVDYIWNGNQNVLVDYTRNFNRIGISAKAGINIDNKQPLLGVGLKYNFSGK